MEEVQTTPEIQPALAPKSLPKLDKRTIWVLVAVVVLGLGGWLLFSQGYLGVSQEEGPCLTLLPVEYCRSGQIIDYIGEVAMGYKLPADIPIIATFDGTYLESSFEGTLFTQMTLAVGENASSTVVISTQYNPMLLNGESFVVGDVIAITAESEEPFDYDSESTLILYTENYDPAPLFID